MNKILTNNVWEQLVEELGDSPKTAAIAYVSSSKYIRFSKNDVLICDASDAAIKTRQTSAEVLKKFYKNSAKLYSYPNLHAKIIWTPEKVVIGSNNLSESSALRLREASVLTDNKTICSQTKVFLHNLIDEAEEIDEKKLKHISEIKLDPVRYKNKIVSTPRKKIDLGNSRWILAISPISDRLDKKEREYIDNTEEEIRKEYKNESLELNYIRYTGNSIFRKTGKPGDIFIQIFKNKNNQKEVFLPAVILKRQDKDNWTRFYYEYNENSISWTEFNKRIKKLTLKKKILYRNIKLSDDDFNKIAEAAFGETK